MTAEWTVMVYLAGDNNLSTAGDKDLQEMRSVGSTDAVNVVAEFDNAGDRGTRRYHIQPGGEGETIVSLGETDSGDPEVLLDFVAWAAEHYPARRYGLILWNHGGGWEPAEMDRIARSVNARNYTPREVTERSATPLARAFFRTTLETIFNLPLPMDRAICSDDGSGHSLDTIELGRVLAQAADLLGQPIDLLGMDACLMSNLEVAYQVRPYARYLVASEESEPNDGWPYDAVLRQLVTDPEMDTPDLAAQIVDAYIASYVDRGYLGPVTQSAFDLSRVEELAAPLDDLADALVSHMPDAAQEIWTAQRGSVRFWHNTLWDVAHFCQVLEDGTEDEAVGAAARAVCAALTPGRERFVIAESHRGAKVESCGGVTVYLLPPLDDLSRYYTELDFAREHRWLTMLEAYHDA